MTNGNLGNASHCRAPEFQPPLQSAHRFVGSARNARSGCPGTGCRRNRRYLDRWHSPGSDRASGGLWHLHGLRLTAVHDAGLDQSNRFQRRCDRVQLERRRLRRDRSKSGGRVGQRRHLDLGRLRNHVDEPDIRHLRGGHGVDRHRLQFHRSVPCGHRPRRRHLDLGRLRRDLDRPNLGQRLRERTNLVLDHLERDRPIPRGRSQRRRHLDVVGLRSHLDRPGPVRPLPELPALVGHRLGCYRQVPDGGRRRRRHLDFQQLRTQLDQRDPVYADHQPGLVGHRLQFNGLLPRGHRKRRGHLDLKQPGPVLVQPNGGRRVGFGAILDQRVLQCERTVPDSRRERRRHMGIEQLRPLVDQPDGKPSLSHRARLVRCGIGCIGEVPGRGSQWCRPVDVVLLRPDRLHRYRGKHLCCDHGKPADGCPGEHVHLLGRERRRLDHGFHLWGQPRRPAEFRSLDG